MTSPDPHALGADRTSEPSGVLESFTVVQKLENMLLVSVPRDLTDSDVLRLRRQILKDVRRSDSQWVLLDFSLVDICDSFFGRFIHSTARMAQLMGARVIVAGLQDAVVETMVDLGMVLPDLHTVLDLDDALALSREYDGERGTGGPVLRRRFAGPDSEPPDVDGIAAGLPSADGEV